MCCFVGFVGEVLGVVVLLVLGVLRLVVVVVTEDDNILFEFHRVFFCFLFPT
jgi:hypothetical protein